MRYFLIKTADNSIVQMQDTPVDLTAQTKPGYKWLPGPLNPKPPYDPATEIVEGPTYTVNANDVTEGWVKRLLTAPELDANKAAKVSAVDALQFKVMFDIENRVRVLEGKQPVTAAQYRNALKAVL